MNGDPASGDSPINPPPGLDSLFDSFTFDESTTEDDEHIDEGNLLDEAPGPTISKRVTHAAVGILSPIQGMLWLSLLAI